MSEFHITMLGFDAMTELDYAAPFDTFARMPDTRVVRASITGEPVTADLGHRVHADTALADVERTDLLFVGGGPGANALMEDEATLAELVRLATGAAWVTSVCTGALVLGAAGLLRGYRAATHWAAMDALVPLGATPTTERVVVDRNRITGGGVTAGIDLALTVAATLHGDDRAMGMQLAMEYAPRPPFACGHPSLAPAPVLERVTTMFAPSRTERMRLAKRAAAYWS